MTTTTKDEALAMIGALAQASVQAYQACNGQSRRSPAKACDLEVKAAAKLFAAICGPDAFVSDDEIEEALGL